MINLPDCQETRNNQSKSKEHQKYGCTHRGMNSNPHAFYIPQLTSRTRNSKYVNSRRPTDRQYTLNTDRQRTQTDISLTKDIVHVLKQQNINLKMQNSFLLNKIKILTEKQQQASQKASADESLFSLLKKQNQELKLKIQEMNVRSVAKVEQFNQKLFELLMNNYSVIKKQKYKQSIVFNNDKMTTKQSCTNSKIVDFKQQQKSLPTKQRMHEQFDYILSLSKIQHDHSKKKQYRYKLVELINKMKELTL